MRTVIFKSCFKDDMQSFMEYRVATFAWNTYRLDNYRLSSFDRYLTKISYNDEIVPQTIINQWLNDVGVPEASINGYIKTIVCGASAVVRLCISSNGTPERRTSSLHTALSFPPLSVTTKGSP